MIKLLGQFNSKKDQTKKWIVDIRGQYRRALRAASMRPPSHNIQLRQGVRHW